MTLCSDRKITEPHGRVSSTQLKPADPFWMSNFTVFSILLKCTTVCLFSLTEFWIKPKPSRKFHSTQYPSCWAGNCVEWKPCFKIHAIYFQHLYISVLKETKGRVILRTIFTLACFGFYSWKETVKPLANRKQDKLSKPNWDSENNFWLRAHHICGAVDQFSWFQLWKSVPHVAIEVSYMI